MREEELEIAIKVWKKEHILHVLTQRISGAAATAQKSFELLLAF